MTNPAISVRGDNGINLLVHQVSVEPEFHVYGYNMNLSVDKSWRPREGLGRANAWKGMFFTSNGDWRTNESKTATFGHSIYVLVPPSNHLTGLPSVAHTEL